MNIGGFLSKRAMLSPEKEAIVVGAVRHTYGQLNARSNRIANSLNAMGIKCGDRVAILSLNEPEYYELYFALGKIGAILVPINFRLAGSEIKYILDDSEPEILILGKEFVDTINTIRETIPLKNYITLGDVKTKWAQNYDALIDQASDEEPEITRGGDDTLTILYTSGTTGRPKGAELTHNGYFNTSVTLKSTLGEIGETLLMPLPLFHIGAMALFPMMVHFGHKIIIQRTFEPKNFLELIEKEKVTWFGSVPQVLAFLKQLPDFNRYDWSSVRMGLVYAAPVPVPLIKEYAKEGIEIRQLYGMTECTGPATVIDGEHALGKAGSCGLPFFHTQIRLVDEKGKDVAPEENGELLVRADNTMKGYWRNPKATADTIKDGWLYTGDIANRDKDGFYYIVDRKKDMIISGGENIYPAELEAALLDNPKISDVGIIGYQDEKWGESVKAVVAVKEGEELTENELIQWCEGKMGRFKIPKKIVFTDNIPRNPTGKILKRVLRELYN